MTLIQREWRLILRFRNKMVVTILRKILLRSLKELASEVSALCRAQLMLIQEILNPILTNIGLAMKEQEMIILKPSSAAQYSQDRLPLKNKK